MGISGSLAVLTTSSICLIACRSSPAVGHGSADQAASSTAIQPSDNVDTKRDVATASPATEAWAGTWILNLEKSSYESVLPPKSSVSRLKRVGDAWEGSQEVVDQEGEVSSVDLRFKFDGQDYVVNGAPNTTWAFTKVDRFTYDLVVKRNGSIVAKARTVVSRDLKTRTTTSQATGPDGRTLTNIAVYERSAAGP